MARKNEQTGEIEISACEQLNITTHNLVDLVDEFETAVYGGNLSKIKHLAECLNSEIELLNFDIKLYEVEMELTKL